MRFFLPSTTVVCKLTLNRRLEWDLEWDIAEPNWPPFPQSSHILAILVLPNVCRLAISF